MSQGGSLINFSRSRVVHPPGASLRHQLRALELLETQQQQKRWNPAPERHRLILNVIFPKTKRERKP